MSLRNGFIFFWIFSCLIALSLLQGAHLLIFQSPQKWTITHIVTTETDKGRATLNYLLQRKADPNFKEEIILLASTQLPSEAFQARGFQVRRVHPQAFEGFKEIQPPYFLVTSPKGEAVYSGNYVNGTNELDIAHSFYNNKLSKVFLAMGCGTAMKAQRAVNRQPSETF